MDIKYLKTFIYAAELNSFTRAGNALGFSQSTVSFHIKQLESELDARLFERVNHTISLTDKGREVLQYAHKVVQLSQNLELSLKENRPVAGLIRLTMADSLCRVFLNERYKKFRSSYEDINLRINAAGTEEMFRMLNQNETDLVFTLDSHIYNAEYKILQEKKIATHFVASVDHPLAGRKQIGVEELVNQPFLLTEKGMSYRRLMDEKLAARSLEIVPVMELGNADQICNLVAENVGISFLPDYVTADAVKAGRLKYLAVEDFDIEIWLQLLHHRDKWISPALQKVIDYCMQTYEEL